MMMRLFSFTLALIASALVALLASAAIAVGNQSSLEKLLKMRADGNYKEAYEGLSHVVLEENGTTGPDLVKAYNAAVACLQQLNRTDDIDAFREKAAEVRKSDWQVLAAVATSYLTCDHHGFMIAGEFRRGQHRGGGRVVNATARDRVQALQLYRSAMTIAQAGDDKRQAAEMLRQFAEAIIYGNQSWRLQSLTDLDKLPDYEEGWGYGGSPQGAPVDEQGNPVFYAVPGSWEAAKSDGERWRWLLDTMVQWQPSLRNEERLIRARFLESQFGVQTLAQFRLLLPEQTAADADKNDAKTGTWALDTLGENETIARLATGIKRFKLPDEHNFIKLYQQVIATTADKRNASALDSLRSLAQLFENRRQYSRAAEYLRLAIQRTRGDVRGQLQQQLDQIVGNWGRFESVMTQPAGRGATVDFRFRNAKHVEFVAHEIDVQKLLDDVKAYLKSKPKQLEWNQLNVSDIGYRLVRDNQKKYVGAEVARWKLELEPREKHFDKRITVTTPLQKAGAYLVTAKIEDGNTSQIVLWLADTAIVRKPMPDKSFYFVADATTGEPVAKANVEFFAYRQHYVGGNNYEIETKDFAEYTDKDGQVFLPIPDVKQDRSEPDYQWLAIATTSSGRLAYTGFDNFWRAQSYDEQYNDVKTFAITDRPVYRPGQTVQFKFWIRHAQYDADDKSEFAHQSFVVEIRDPRNEKVFSQTLTSDNYGGIAGKFELADRAMLGQYQLSVVNRGGGTFRVEEYKKPEYEVSVDAPTAPVMLGEKITAKIRAKYYFGSPVVNATVRYKVLRTVHTTHWYPPGPWDWLYGPGYRWLSPDYNWYPGWSDWGCRRPTPSWIWIQPSPPEIVAQREVPIGADGTVNVEIDTSVAKALHPDDDERYTIEAEVVDQSRRTIVGRGDVLVARQPFQVYAWVDRGYYRVSDTIKANFAARRIDGKPVEGTGKLRLLKVTYGPAPERKPMETEVRSWTLATDAEGKADIQLTASEKGQYRLSYSVTDKAGHEIEGGYLFTIIGDGFDGSEFRFNSLELVPDKAEYGPNEKVQLQINTNHVGSTVLLFVRPCNGIYLPPQILQLKGKSTVVDVGVTQKDMPNFFVEAMTIANGRVYTEIRDIHVPPVKRILNLEVAASAPEFKPGQHAKVTVKITDAAGKPYVGSVVLSIYDKSVEYISGGSNVPDIKEFFWKWRRDHRPYLETNLDRWFNNLVPHGQKTMENIGIFGELAANESTSELDTHGEPGSAGIGGGRNRIFLGAAVAQAPMATALPMGSAPGAGLIGEARAKGLAGPPPETPPSPPGGPLAQPTIRSEFADTAYWAPSLETNKDGIAEAELDMPQNLTTWKIEAWGMGQGTR
ncbi:MAG TPA: MG2 domain-containing protein, partial [Lacipirellulaceae bacterium]|nr:MG2 domain-containing protein [Lacipirellulaceae bacterium]